MNQFTPSEELTGVFARMSGLLLSYETVQSALGIVSSLAMETIPRSVGAGVTVLDARGRPTTTGASDAVVEQADALQYELEQGPCLSAWRDRVVYRIDDITTDKRWPEWAAEVAGLGLRSALSAPLVAADAAFGAMKVYSTEPGAYDTRAEHLLSLFAAQAAVLVANVASLENAKRLGEGARQALLDRDSISLAKGILMGRDGVDEAQAFALLVSTADREGLQVRDVAERLVRTSGRRRV